MGIFAQLLEEQKAQTAHTPRTESAPAPAQGQEQAHTAQKTHQHKHKHKRTGRTTNTSTHTTHHTTLNSPPFNTAVAEAAGSTEAVDPHGGQGHRETLYFPDRVAGPLAQGDREATRVVAAGGNWNPGAGAAVEARSWRRDRAGPCPAATAREATVAAAGWVSDAGG
jgi:hypothetical protein